MNSSYVFVFLEGILTFISPCLLPLIPIYFLYLGGSVDEKGKQNIKRSKLLTNASGFVLGFSMVFIILGVIASLIGGALGNNSIVRIASGILIIIFGLSFMGVFKLKFLSREKKLTYNFDKLNFLKSVIFGVVFSFGWSPCVGPLLGTALGLAANKESVIEGMLLLTVYSLGLAIPFMLSAFIFDQLKGAIGVIQKYTDKINFVSGILLVIVGILLLFDKLYIILPSV
jgi:cytochrome c-type biogenesis protein